MTEGKTALKVDNVVTRSQPEGNLRRVCAVILAGAAILSSAFHFWPLENSKVWQMLSPSNISIILWVLVLTSFISLRRRQFPSISILPHISVFAYVTINILSVAFTPHLNRTTGFTIKLILMLVPGFMLFSSAVFSKASLRLVYGLATAAVIISISCCLTSRFVFLSEKFGFHNNAYKYGTYIGILSPLCGAYLLKGDKRAFRLLGMVILIAALLSSGYLGATAAIAAGIMALIIVSPYRSVRLRTIGCLLFMTGVVVLLRLSPAIAFDQSDFDFAEKDGVNLRQRYIEWQAQLNLLEERPITGTAAGCINEYRSKFYYRLPKLNTLKPFDQNGWLATGSETGILGLLCFCWIVIHYGRLSLSHITAAGDSQSTTIGRFAGANFAGLVSACTANLFSSIHYNGTLIVFVLVLALISKTNRLRGGP